MPDWTPLTLPAALEAAVCPICRAEGVPRYSHRDLFCGLEGEFGQRYCPACGVFFLSPRVREESIGRYYPQEYGPYQPPGNGLLDRVGRTVGLTDWRRRVVERFVSGGKLLDVGCGSGTFLGTLQEDRWERLAFDIAPHREFPFRARYLSGKFDRDSLPLENVDAITMWHVFEHLYDPQHALNHALRILGPRGYVFLAIPDLRCLERPAFGRFWTGWDPPRHIATYSRRGMAELLERAGFELVDVVADTPAGELLALNFELALRSQGKSWNVHRWPWLRLLVFPFAIGTAMCGLASAKIYIGRKKE
jgi:SAM-dependent methyltransferase